MKKSNLVVMSWCAALLLSACGGGGDDDWHGDAASAAPAAAQSAIPVAATTSAVSAFEFVHSVTVQTVDDAEPFAMADEVLAVSDTDEPDARF
jgi:hypothetical protein